MILTENQRRPLILVAEDDEDDQLMLEDAFEEVLGGSKQCPELRFFKNGIELLSHLREKLTNHRGVLARQPDLIMLDLNMPLKDGRQTLMEIKTNALLWNLPTIILTTSNNSDDRIACEALGADDYIVKPSRYSALLDVVASLPQRWSHPPHPVR